MSFIKITQVCRDVDEGVLLASVGVRTGYTYKHEWDTQEDTVTLTSLNGGWSWTGPVSVLDTGALYHDVDAPGPIKSRSLLNSAYLRDVWREQALAFDQVVATEVVTALKNEAAGGLFRV